MNLDSIQNLVEQDNIIFLTYGGFLTQTLIAGMTEALEKETQNSSMSMGEATNVFTIFIELAQNIMKYSKSKQEDCDEVNSEGLIVVGKDDGCNYFIHSQSVIALEDKEKIEPKLKEITALSKDELKLRYRELRRSGEQTHEKGGGIGFYEIAKRSDNIQYEFKKINDDKYYFHFISTVYLKDKEK
jgi:hypothetical protein